MASATWWKGKEGKSGEAVLIRSEISGGDTETRRVEWPEALPKIARYELEGLHLCES
jgi:hypothetical protein